LNTLGDGANKFNGLSDKQKACFLNITAALQWAGIKTDMQKPLSSDSSGWGIQEDRLMFAAPIGNLEEQVRAAIKNRSRRGDKGFVSDKPLKSEHKGMNYWGGATVGNYYGDPDWGGPEGAFVRHRRVRRTYRCGWLFWHTYEGAEKQDKTSHNGSVQSRQATPR
jgi:hypothetical protein